MKLSRTIEMLIVVFGFSWLALGQTINGAGLILPAVAAGRQHSLALTTNGSVWAWGRNDYGQVGDGSFVMRATPVPVTNLSGVALICSGHFHNLAVQTNGTARAWGANGYGQLGTNVSGSSSVPVAVPGLSGVVAVAVGDYHSLAVKADGTVWAWGYNGNGGLGDGTIANRTSAGLVTNLSGAVGVAGGYAHSLAVKSNGTVWAWGYNGEGELGDGTTANRLSPVPVTNLTDVIAVAAGEYHSLALQSGGTVWAWGYNSSGQLGDGTYTTRTSPVPVTNLSGVVAIAGAAAGNFSLALKSDGTVWAWGANGYGQLGDGTTTGRNRPVQVTNLSGVVAIAAGMVHGLALKSDGTVWAWGNNNPYSQLGNGTNVDSRTPVQVSNLNAGSGGPASGALMVTITPAGAVSAGALWNVDGGTWTNSGATISGVNAGSHTVNFNTVSGWTAPVALEVTITGGATTTTNGNYTAVGTTRIIGVSGNLAFGNVATGTTATATLTITNSGNATLTVSGISYPSGFSGAWSGPIATGDAHNVTVTFAPVAVTSYGGTVTVNSDATSGAGTIGASGSGTANVATQGTTNLLINPGAETGDVSGWTTGGDSGPIADNGLGGWRILPHSGVFSFTGNLGATGLLSQTVSLIGNQGLTASLIDSGECFAAVSFWEQGWPQGDPSDNGSVTLACLGGTSNELSAVTTPVIDSHDGVWSNYVNQYALPVGTRFIRYTMSFLRHAGDNLDAYLDDNSLRVVWGSPSSRIIGLSGSLAFGNVTAGATATATLTITNSGNATLTVSGISYPSGFSGAWSGPIVAGSAQNVTVTFAPMAVTSYGGTVTVNSDATGGIGTTTASGTGVAASTSSYTFTTLAGLATVYGTNDDIGSAARFYCPRGVAADSAGNVYVADSYNNAIRKVTPAGAVTTLAGLAGMTNAGSADGLGSAARFYQPTGVAVDSAGNVYVADFGNHTIRKVTPDGVVTTLAGSAGVEGNADGTGSTARFDGPWGVAADSTGNVYVADFHNCTIRKVTPAGVVTTLAGSAGNIGSADGTGSAARFYGPSAVAVDSAGNVYVADSGNATIRKVTPAGVVTTLAGSAGVLGSADGTGSAARFHAPIGVAVDGTGCVFVAEFIDDTIRKVTPAGLVTTIGGSAGNYGNADGTGSVARFFGPVGVAADNAGNVYVGDFDNHTIRMGVPAGTAPAPTITTSSPLPNGAVGSAYSLPLAASGGTPPYTWTVSAGMLPTGLSLSNSTGVISGTPSVVGTAGFTIRCTGADSQYVDKAFSLTISGSSPTGLATPAVAAGRQHSLALTTNGSVWGWGRNDYGQVGDGSFVTRATPVAVTNLSGVAQICSGHFHNLAVQTNGTVRAWGANGYGQLGTNVSGSSSVPVAVPGLSGVVAVAVGDYHSLAVKADGTVWAWGYNGNGGLGDGTTANRTSAGLVTNLSGAMDVAGGYAHSLAVKSNGTVWAWGYNGDGELGDGTTANRLSPVPVTNLSGVIAVAAGEYHSLALRSGGTVWAWGYNSSGQLGDGTYTTRTSPVPVTNLSGVVAIAGAAAGNFSLALKSDGTVWAWGANGYGQLGDGTTTGRNRPVQVTNLSGVVAIAAGMVHGLALKSDGTVWAWGNNSPYSQLGNGTNVDSRTPVQVSNLNAGSGGPAGTPFEEWLILHFGSLDNPDARPDADPDSDGAPNRLEFPAGTNPTNRASVLRLQQPQRQGNDILLTWTTAGGRTNVVQWAAGVADDSFSDLGAPLIIAGQGDATTNRVDPGAATNALRFYRIRLGP